MSHCFRFIGTKAEAGWVIGDDETLHLAKVLKLAVGTVVEVTDGAGSWGRGEITVIQGKQTLVAATESFYDEEPATFVSVAIGALKPGSIDDVLPAAVELGADQIIVFQNAGTAKFRLQDSVWARWQRIIHQSIKQCKRSRIPQVVVCDSVGALIEGWRREGGAGIVLDAHAAAPLHRVVAAADTGRITLVIGSEKGLEASELEELAAAGFQSALLGSNILRAVTAIPAALGVLASIKK